MHHKIYKRMLFLFLTSNSFAMQDDFFDSEEPMPITHDLLSSMSESGYYSKEAAQEVSAGCCGSLKVGLLRIKMCMCPQLISAEERALLSDHD